MTAPEPAPDKHEAAEDNSQQSGDHPTDTDHPTGEAQARENTENEPPG